MASPSLHKSKTPRPSSPGPKPGRVDWLGRATEQDALVIASLTMSARRAGRWRRTEMELLSGLRVSVPFGVSPHERLTVLQLAPDNLSTYCRNVGTGPESRGTVPNRPKGGGVLPPGGWCWDLSAVLLFLIGLVFSRAFSRDSVKKITETFTPSCPSQTPLGQSRRFALRRGDEATRPFRRDASCRFEVPGRRSLGGTSRNCSEQEEEFGPLFLQITVQQDHRQDDMMDHRLG
ncbi:hypothetical protein COCON_G00001510 [Conger conger]|uniref:Uncharacterized protein n=1 Tax=Conger conger TaxID=82655 RepID=A0A9Q1E0Q1_CONCO|nr:hypothetical protein COCON_G00001510 [Conger conger]